ncbi:MAG: deoxyribodipyrimidine photo-lyase [Rickettsiaceae bacterium]
MSIVIHWFRQDLRLFDNPSLFEAAKSGAILPIYILDNYNSTEYSIGSASRWWLYHSLKKLNNALNGKLITCQGNPEKILLELAQHHNVQIVHWNRCYEPWQIKRDQNLKTTLIDHNIQVKTYNGSLLWEPWEILKSDGSPYKVFTPYYRNGCLRNILQKKTLPKPTLLFAQYNQTSNIEDLKLLPESSWYKKLDQYWNIGEKAATQRIDSFIQKGLVGYKEGRNFPARHNVSKLSPHLHFGEISPNYLWYKITSQESMRYNSDIDYFCRELGWREFSYYLLYHFPTLPKQNFNTKFNSFPWEQNLNYLTLWQQGKTGITIVDAGMRELLQTGYIHNRVRMIAASFLVKNLRLHWSHGASWFWQCLVDADLANNSFNWQWVAGCGTDTMPYFRIFNPVTQGQKFDPTGEYTRKYVPELQNITDKYLFNPWEAPKHILQNAGIELSITYPMPIIDLKKSRQSALDAFALMKRATEDNPII